jgi:hypothetical protein
LLSPRKKDPAKIRTTAGKRGAGGRFEDESACGRISDVTHIPLLAGCGKRISRPALTKREAERQRPMTRESMQKITVADHQMLSVEDGRKTIAVRVGFCHVGTGPLEVRSASGFWPTANVEVRSVERKPISALSTEELRQNGYSDPAAMVEMLRPSHPCVSSETEATVIKWDLAS